MTVPAERFVELYARRPDPWGLRDTWFERRKRALALAALPRPRYRRAFEAGCANGDLTRQLAARCERVTAVDCVPRAVEEARRALASVAGVDVALGALPGALAPAGGAGPYDLMVFSEVLYYLSSADLDAVLEAAEAALEPGGDLVAVHRAGPSRDGHLYDGRDVHASIAERETLEAHTRVTEARFVLEVFRRTAATRPPSGPADGAPHRVG